MTKYQQVSVDLVNMVYTAIAYLALAGAAWLFLRLISACFWLPGHMKRQNDVQRMLQSKIESYERYIAETEAKEASEEFKDESGDSRTLEERRKERQDCLDMLKRELKRIQDGGDPYDMTHLLDDEEKKLLADDNDDDDDDVDEDDDSKEERDQNEKQLSNLEEIEKFLKTKPPEPFEPKKIK